MRAVPTMDPTTTSTALPFLRLTLRKLMRRKTGFRHKDAATSTVPSPASATIANSTGPMSASSLVRRGLFYAAVSPGIVTARVTKTQ